MNIPTDKREIGFNDFTQHLIKNTRISKEKMSFKDIYKEYEEFMQNHTYNLYLYTNNALARKLNTFCKQDEHKWTKFYEKNTVYFHYLAELPELELIGGRKQ